MKRTSYISTFFIFLTTQFLFINPIKSTSVASSDDSWKNWYGTTWNGTPVYNTKYAKQMGHDYIAIQGYPKRVVQINESKLGI